MPFVFNLRTVLTARHRCRSSLNQLNVVCCEREVVEQVKRPHPSHKQRKEVIADELHDEPSVDRLAIVTSNSSSLSLVYISIMHVGGTCCAM
jgi:hypothetical protein